MTRNKEDVTLQFTVLTEQEYEVFQNHHMYRDFMNSTTAMSLKRKNNWNVEYVGVKEGNEILCATVLTSIPIMKVYTFYYAQRGFLIDYSDETLLAFFTKELTSYLNKRKCLYLILDPNVLYKERDIDGNLVEGGFDHSYVIDNLTKLGYQHQGFSNDFSVISEVRWMFSLYLEGQDEKCLLKGMHQQTRWSVNKTLKQGIQVRELSVDEIDIFTKMMDHTSQRRNFSARTSDFYKKQLETYKDEAKLLMAYLDLNDFRARLDEEKATLASELAGIEEHLEGMPNNKKFLNKKKVCLEAIALNEKKYKDADALEEQHGAMIPMATSFFIVHGDEVTYLYSAAYDEFKKYNAPYAIQWHMMRYALQHGIRRYNFYGISGNFDPNADDYGVYEFKKGFGGVVEELVGDFILPIKKGAYKLYTTLKQK